MRPEERDLLRRRFQFRCGYCGVREQDVGADLTVDHFQPHSRGGVHEFDNWVYSCHACNEFKGDYWQPDSLRRILHPLQDDLASHFSEETDGTLRPLTETGAFHIERLHLNRRQLVAYRHERRLLDNVRQAQASLVDRLKQLEDRLQALLLTLGQLQRDDSNGNAG